MAFDSDDPRLTAYILGELDEGERAEIEAELKNSAELRRTVEELRNTVELVTRELAAEPRPQLTPDERESLTAHAEENPSGPEQGEVVTPATKIVSRRRTRWLAVALAASLAGWAGTTFFFLGSVDSEQEIGRAHV